MAQQFTVFSMTANKLSLSGLEKFLGFEGEVLMGKMAKVGVHVTVLERFPPKLRIDVLEDNGSLAKLKMEVSKLILEGCLTENFNGFEDAFDALLLDARQVVLDFVEDLAADAFKANETGG